MTIWSARRIVGCGLGARTGAATASPPPGPPSPAAPAPAAKASANARPAPPSAPLPWREAVEHAPIHFATDMVPILTKAGCNQGSCHGAQSGKGGFKQSLRGWDPSFDWEQVA